MWGTMKHTIKVLNSVVEATAVHSNNDRKVGERKTSGCSHLTAHTTAFRSNNTWYVPARLSGKVKFPDYTRGKATE